MKTIITALLMVSMAYGQGKTAPQQGPPPRNLTQKADGHFTANQDPVNPEKFEIYTVKTGDTLSEISGSVMKNSRLWPQLWEQNDHIVNPHWIYPNDKILIRPITRITEAAPPPPDTAAEPAPAPSRSIPAPVFAPTPTPAVAEAPKPEVIFDLGPPRIVPEIKMSDLYCSGFVRKAFVPPGMKVTAKYNADGSALGTGTDYVYISQGVEDGVRPGTMFRVVRPTRKIEGFIGKTKTDRDLGMHFLDVAQIQVVTAQADFSMAKIVNGCEAIELGDLILPFEQLVLPDLPRPREFSPFMKTKGDLEGSVVMTRSALINFGSVFHSSGVIPGARTASLDSIQKGVVSEGGVVYLDLGQSSGVKPGDVFIVYRSIAVDRQLYDVPKESGQLANWQTAIGEVVVLKVGEAAATALVTFSALGVSAGDSVSRR